MHVQGFVKNYWAPLLLLAIGVAACLANYTPGTFLSGWDTLHPEFNFPLAFERAFFGVFRPEQGLGAVAAHSQMADLPHIAFLWIINFFLQPLTQALNLPDASLPRYLYIFLCYILGPIGMYLFLKQLFPSKVICFLGSLFYMLNIGTVQLFFVPFEMFTTQYALLPFLFFFTTDFLITKRRRSIIGFSIMTILSSPIAFAATLWYVQFGILASYCIPLTLFLLRKGQAKQIRRIFLLLFVFIALNLYWILPNIYFVFLHGASVTRAAANQLFSEEAFLYNKAFGNLSSVALLRTFYFNWQMYGSASFVQLLSSWETYLTTPLLTIQYGFFGTMVFGIFLALKQKNHILISFLPGIAISLLFLLNDNLPFHIYNLLQQIPLFQEAFRFPDDKILGVYVFLYTIFFTFGIYSLPKFFKPILRLVLFFIFVLCIFITSFPIFQGQLIQPAMRVTIPQEYFAMFDYLNQQPPGRIATLPIQSLWGWEYYSWQGKTGFQGSGFLSFGLKDPTMDRDFDRWNPANEAYYHELSYAVYSQNQALFKQVLEKYDISYVLLDTSIIAPDSAPDVLFYKQLQNLLAEDKIRSIAQFKHHLFVYKTHFPSAPVRLAKHLPTKPGSLTAAVDRSYQQNGTYITKNSIDTTNNLAWVYPLSYTQTTKYSFTKNLYPTLVTSPKITTCTSEDFAKTDTTKAVIKTINPFVEYVSRNGQYCDHINVTTRIKNTPFLVKIDNRNLSGLSLRLCIVDSSNSHCIVQTKLPEVSSFQTTTILVPPLPTTKFSINFANIGIAPTASINDISGIRIEELASQTITPNPVPDTVTAILAKALNNNTLYTIPSASPNTTLVFSQSYEPGWQLYAIPKSTPSLLAYTLPFFVGKPLQQHLLINSWENGWILPKTDTNKHLLIVFLPQYLEYIGFGIGIITLLILLIYKGIIEENI